MQGTLTNTRLTSDDVHHLLGNIRFTGFGNDANDFDKLVRAVKNVYFTRSDQDYRNDPALRSVVSSYLDEDKGNEFLVRAAESFKQSSDGFGFTKGENAKVDQLVEILSDPQIRNQVATSFNIQVNAGISQLSTALLGASLPVSGSVQARPNFWTGFVSRDKAVISSNEVNPKQFLKDVYELLNKNYGWVMDGYYERTEMFEGRRIETKWNDRLAVRNQLDYADLMYGQARDKISNADLLRHEKPLLTAAIAIVRELAGDEHKPTALSDGQPQLRPSEEIIAQADKIEAAIANVAQARPQAYWR